MMRLAQAILARIFPVLTGARSVYRRVRRPITVGVRALIVEDNQVVLVRTHGSDVWDLPGGGVKRGETLRAAAMREAEEETGCQVNVHGLLGVYLNTQDYLSDHVSVFLCRPCTAPSLGLNLEIAEARSWSLDALPPTIPPATHRRLAEYAAGERGVEGRW
jgi:ADP-ribose pyrophosphatase YjhB (NUDIX family)